MKICKSLILAMAAVCLSMSVAAIDEVEDEDVRRDTIQKIDFDTRTLTIGDVDFTMNEIMKVYDEGNEGTLTLRHESFLAPGQNIRFVVSQEERNGQVSYSITKIIRSSGE